MIRWGILCVAAYVQEGNGDGNGILAFSIFYITVLSSSFLDGKFRAVYVVAARSLQRLPRRHERT